MSDASRVLETQELVAGYSAELDILNGVSITVDAGEIVTVVGPNGAGKSTLMKSIIGLVAPRKGRVLLRGEEITGRRPHEIVRLGLGYVPQRENVFENMTVIENLELGAMGRSRAEVASRIEELLRLFPRLGRAAQAARGHHVRRRAPDGGHGPRPDAQARHPAAGRALRRPGAACSSRPCSSRWPRSTPPASPS